jgi:hypothetical protein
MLRSRRTALLSQEMAAQREQVKRRVALKLIELGLDSRQIVARFEAEPLATQRQDRARRLRQAAA